MAHAGCVFTCTDPLLMGNSLGLGPRETIAQLNLYLNNAGFFHNIDSQLCHFGVYI